ncbi:MAG: caspase family protein [Comamonadaceae bacterium]|nr:MAG: caspase family protein [Comamonadaceae bacterium]
MMFAVRWRAADVMSGKVAAVVAALAVCAALFAPGLCAAADAAPPGIALVIGNNKYPRSPLANPRNDAQAVGAALRQLDFAVTELYDGSLADILRAVAALAEKAASTKTPALLYYAGHGVQSNWKNYLIPVDARIARPADLAAQTIDLADVIKTLTQEGIPSTIVILDACRDNPFGAQDDFTQAKGFAPTQSQGNIFLAYATLPGNLADDADDIGKHGRYTASLLEELKTRPGEITEVFRRVQFKVRRSSVGRQVPSEQSTLSTAFSFSAAGLKPPPATFAAERSAYAEQKAAWDAVRRSEDAENIYRFLDTYPTGPLSEIAKMRLDQLQRVLITAQLSEAETEAANQDKLYNPVTGADLRAAGKHARTNYGLDSADTSRFRWGDKYTVSYRDTSWPFGRSIEKTLLVVGIGAFQATLQSGLYQRASMTSLGGRITEESVGGQGAGAFFDPPLALMPAQYQVGYEWSSQSQVSGPRREFVTLKARVAGVESATVGQDKWPTYRIEGQKQTTLESGVTKVRYFTTWASPDHGLPVRYQESDTPGGKPVYIEQMLSFAEGNR